MSATAQHAYGDKSDCTCGRNFATVRGLREHLTKARHAPRPLQEVLDEHCARVRAQREVDQENAARSAALQQNAAVDRRVNELRAGR